MTVPRLNRRLTLETPQRVSDGAGGFVSTWMTLGVIWGDLTARSGRERGQGGAAVSQVTYKITVRGAADNSPQRPRPEQRLRDGNRIFTIRAVTEYDPDGRFLTCFADEEVIA